MLFEASKLHHPFLSVLSSSREGNSAGSRGEKEEEEKEEQKEKRSRLALLIWDLAGFGGVSLKRRLSPRFTKNTFKGTRGPEGIKRLNVFLVWEKMEERDNWPDF